MLLGPYALNLAASDISPVLAELGVVFLVFTLGLEFSLPRMIAMRREALQVGARPGAADYDRALRASVGVRRAAAGGGPDRRRARDVLDRDRRSASSASRPSSIARTPHRRRHPAVSGPRLRAAPGARKRPGRDVGDTRLRHDRQRHRAGGASRSRWCSRFCAGSCGRCSTKSAARAAPICSRSRRCSSRSAPRGRRTRSACRWRSARFSPGCCSPKRNTGISSK